MTVIRARDHLLLAGAMGAMPAPAARPFIHPEMRADAPRAEAEMAHDRAFLQAHDTVFHTDAVPDFTPRETSLWRGGVWRNEWHYGRLGWWWVVNEAWYPYDDPVYPYPNAVARPEIYATTRITPAGRLAQTALARTVNAIAPLPAAPPGWYRCGEPAGYYPAIGACNGLWALVQDPPPLADTP